MPPVVVRFAGANDLFALIEIEKAAAKAFLPYASRLNISPKLLEGLAPLKFLQQAQAERRLWVATYQERIVGFVAIEFLIESCFIVELDVHPDFWRRGIGSALVEACCLGAKARSFSKMTLTTFRLVPWNIPFYQQLGFKLLPSENWSREIWAIVQHEARYGFLCEKRAVMVRSLESNFK